MKYKLYIHTYNNLEEELLYRESPYNDFIKSKLLFTRTLRWHVYNIDIDSLWRHKPMHTGSCDLYSFKLFNKLFTNNKLVITYEQYKDVIKRSSDGPLEVLYWDIALAMDRSHPAYIHGTIVFRDLKTLKPELYIIRRHMQAHKYLDIIKPIMLHKINSMELLAIKEISKVRKETLSNSITCEEYDYYSNMSREKVIEELAMKHISEL